MKLSMSKGGGILGEGSLQRTLVSVHVLEGGGEADGLARDSCF